MDGTMINDTTINDAIPADFVEVDYIEEDTDEAVFKQGYIRNDWFVCTTWFLNNFALLNKQVWWGYKVGYYTFICPAMVGVLCAVDLAVISVRHVLIYVLKRIFDFVMDGIMPFAKIIMAAAALILVVLFIFNQGWDGLNNLYKHLCEMLSK